jgi:hypothetical protein
MSANSYKVEQVCDDVVDGSDNVVNSMLGEPTHTDGTSYLFAFAFFIRGVGEG